MMVLKHDPDEGISCENVGPIKDVFICIEAIQADADLSFKFNIWIKKHLKVCTALVAQGYTLQSDNAGVRHSKLYMSHRQSILRTPFSPVNHSLSSWCQRGNRAAALPPALSGNLH